MIFTSFIVIIYLFYTITLYFSIDLIKKVYLFTKKEHENGNLGRLRY